MASYLKYFWDHVEEVLGAFFMGVMAFLSFMNVVTRYVLNYSTAWTEELVTYVFVWATLVGSALAYKQGANLMVAFLYNRTHGAARKFLYLLSAFAGVLFFGFLGYHGFIQVRDEFSYNTLMESMPIAMAYFSAAIPVCSLLIIWRIVQKTYNDLRNDVLERSGDDGSDVFAG